jgi:hypothetical protein
MGFARRLLKNIDNPTVTTRLKTPISNRVIEKEPVEWVGKTSCI